MTPYNPPTSPRDPGSSGKRLCRQGKCRGSEISSTYGKASSPPVHAPEWSLKTERQGASEARPDQSVSIAFPSIASAPRPADPLDLRSWTDALWPSASTIPWDAQKDPHAISGSQKFFRKDLLRLGPADPGLHFGCARTEHSLSWLPHFLKKLF